MIRILISSAGRRVELIKCFRNAAREMVIDLEIVAIDMIPEWSPACQIADAHYAVPHCTAHGFLETILEFCQHHHINLIIPTIDTELSLYAENRGLFIENGTDILVSDPGFVRVARDKEETAVVLKQHGIATPHTWKLEECLSGKSVLPFPLLLKPRGGSCSNGIIIIDSMEKLQELSINSEDNILQELCQGKEYTINAFYNRDGKCVACVPHFRKMVRAGEVCFAETVRIPAFRSIADKFGKFFRACGGTFVSRDL